MNDQGPIQMTPQQRQAIAKAKARLRLQQQGQPQPAAPEASVAPEQTPWGDGQAFDDLYARKPQTDPMLSPLRPDARTLTSGQPTRLKPPPAPRGPVMSPSQRMATQPARDADVARRAEQANRWKNDSPFGTPVDEMGMPIAVTDAQRDGGMYGVRDDVGKGIVASPIHAERALVGAAEATLNTPGDLARSLAVPFAMGFDPTMQGIIAGAEFGVGADTLPERFAAGAKAGGYMDMQQKLDAAPRFDFSAAKAPVPKELESVSGALAEGLAQFLISRKLVGKVAPGGGLAANMGKDAAAVFVGMDGSTGRMADVIDANAIPQGPLRDYFNFLKTQPDDSPALGRFKNFLEDLTVSGPMIVPQTVIAPAARVVGNAINPTMTPTNAGGVAARAGLTRPQITPVAPAAAATQPQQPVAPTATQTAQQAPTQPQTATAPLVPPIPPTAPAVMAGAPQPGPAGQVPPVGQLNPVPNLGPAEQAFNNLPMKTRESMLNAFKSAGVEPNRAKAMIGELNNLPDGQNTMYALEIMRRNGLSDPDIDGVLVAMGREFATESPRPSGRVFNREQDSARQIMNDQVRTQINSEGRSITDVAESRFGPGVVPAGEALDLELDQLSNAYETILSTKRSPTGNLRSPAKKDAVYKAREDLTNALVSPSVMQTIPDDVKLQIMMQASDDMRRLKFKPEELDVVLQGDGAVLAPLFEGYGALSWSPELWSHLARQYPTQAAHSLQSALRKAADEAFRRGDATAGRYYKRLRGESGKGGLLDTLERAVPKYKETRVQFGDASSAKEALDILERFKAAAANEGDVAKIIKDLDGLPQRHREMAEQQITSIIRQELARKVESPRLAELGQTVAQTPNLTALSRQDFLKALEDVFGPRGKELADSIRSSRARTDTLTGISPKYNSRTELNRQDVQNAPALYEAPGSLEGGIIDQGVKRLGTVAGGASLIPGGQGAAIALGAATAVQAAMNAARRGQRLSNAERNALVDYLFKSRTAGDAAPAAATRGPSMGDYAQAIGRDAVIGAGIGAVADGDPLNNDPMALIGGALGGAAGYGRARFRNARSLIKPPPAPRGAGRPNPPPAGPGVGGPNAPRPLPGQTSSASPAVTGAVVGGIGGAMADREDPARGALLGGLGGAALGSRFGRGVQPPKPRVSPPPVGGRAPPERMGFGAAQQAEERGPMFYSALSRAVEKSPTTKAPASQWKATIANSPGVKAEEIEWTGVNDWLDMQTGPVTKQQVAEYLDGNGVKIEETVRGAPSGEALRKQEEIQRELLPRIEKLQRLNNEFDQIAETDAVRAAVLWREIKAVAAEAEALKQALDAADVGTTTKWSSYTLPRGENYRELLIRMPTKQITKLPDQYEVMSSAKPDGDSQWWIAHNDGGPDIGFGNSREEAIADGLRYLNDRPQGTYKSSHWDEPNVLAHIRFSERMAGNRKVLAIEEIQSDWHQAGRDKGYRTPEVQRELARLDAELKAASAALAKEDARTLKIITGYDSLKDSLESTKHAANRNAVAQFRNNDDAWVRAYNGVKKAEADVRAASASSSVPNAPFKNNAWASLSLKRMIRWAAENGFDEIAWVPGQVPVERFNLSQALGDVTARQTPDGRVSFTPGNGSRAARQSLQRFGEAGRDGDTIMTREQAVEAFGKDAGSRMFDGANGQGKVFAGEDLNVGGEGMRAFYDKILVNEANKLGKKYGAQVGQTEIPTGEDPGARRDLRDRKTPFHSLPITPELKKQALGGQALMSIGGRTGRGIADNLKQDAGLALFGSAGGSFANQDDPQAGALAGMGLALGGKYGGRAVNAMRGTGRVKPPPVRGADQASFGGRRGTINENRPLSEIIQRGKSIDPSLPTPDPSAIAAARADTRVSGAATAERLNVIVPEAERVVGGTYTPGAPGGGNWTDLSPEFLSAKGPGFNVTDDELADLWRQSVERSSQAAKNAVSKHQVVPTFPAKQWDAAMRLPYRDMLWYELSGEAFGNNLPDLTAKEFIHSMDVVGATSARAKPDENLERTLAAISRNMQGKPIDVDLTQPSAVSQALTRKDLGTSALPGNKTGHFSDTLALTGGVPTRFPISVNDVWVGKMFGIDDTVMSSNQSLHEPMAIYFNKLRDLYNQRHGGEITEAMKTANPQMADAPPFNLQSWNFQAPAWVHLRTQTSGAATGDAYHQVWDGIINKLNSAGIPGIDGQKITREALMHPGFADALRRTAGPWRAAPKATIEFGTKLTPVGKAARERFDRAVLEGDELTQKEYLKPILSGLYESARGDQPWEKLTKAITGRMNKTEDITRIDHPTQENPLDVGGSFEGDLSPNIRIPLKGLTDDQIADFNAVAGQDLRQAAMAVSQVLAVGADAGEAVRDGYIRGLSMFVPTVERMSPDDLRALSKALNAEGHTFSYNRYPNGYQFDINPNFDGDMPRGISDTQLTDAFNSAIGSDKYGSPELFTHDYKSVYTESGDYADRIAAISERITDDFAKAAGLSKSAAQRHLARNSTALTGGAKSAWNTARARRDSLAEARKQFQALAQKVEDGHAAFLEKAGRRDAKARPPANKPSGPPKVATKRPLPGQTSQSAAFIGSGLASGGIAGGATYAATGDEDLALRAGIGAGIAGGIVGNRFANRAGPPRARISPPGVKPPPQTMGFGGMGASRPTPAKGPPKPRVSPPKGPGTLSRMVAGGAVGGLAGSLGGDANAQEDLTDKISQTEQTIADLKKAMADLDKITDPFEKQRFLKAQGYYAGRIDGDIAGKTTEGMERWKAKKEADLEKAEGERKDLVRRDALQSNRPDPLMMALREYGPAVLGIGALFGMKYMRGGAAKASVATAEATSNKLNKLITKGPVTGAMNKRDENRFANLNKLWQKGGASKDELPFKQDGAGKYKPNAKAKLPEELFADSGVWQTVTKYVKGKDVAIILGGGLDVAIAQPFIDKANENLTKAEAAWNDTPSDETAKALEDAKNEVAAYTLLQRIGMGVAAGRILGTFGGAYAKPIPNIPAAASEQAKLKQFIVSQKPPPKPRAKANPPAPKPKPKPRPKPPVPPAAPPTSQLPLPLKGGGKKKP